MAITYTDDLSTLTPDRLSGFFVGWPTAPSPEQHLAVLRGSYRAVIAMDTDTGSDTNTDTNTDTEPQPRGRVVGFITMISDGVLTAFIPWLEVLPEYQARGIGAELVRRILEGTERFYSVDLLCDAPLQEYYAKFGMQAVPGMTLRHRSALRGPAADAG